MRSWRACSLRSPRPGFASTSAPSAGATDHAWLALDDAGSPLADRALVRDAVSIVGLCELAEESAGGGDPATLRARLAEVREAEQPEGIEEAEQAAAELESEIAEPASSREPQPISTRSEARPRVSSARSASSAPSPFAQAMQAGTVAVEEFARDVERAYKRPLG